MTRAICVALFAACSAPSCAMTAGQPERIDRFRELEIVAEEVVASPRASNASSGPFSFRHLVVEIAGSEEAAADMVEDWLASSDSPALRATLTEWRATAARADLARAPFRLLAISNRVDLGDEPDAASPSGEGRFVFGLTHGPGDDLRSRPRAVTVIFEYALPGRSPRQWAEAWHALGRASGEEHAAGLEALTESFTTRGAWPGRPCDSALAQVRTNDSESSEIATLAEYALDRDGALVPRRVRNTPRPELDVQGVVSRFAEEHERDVLAGRHVLPAELCAETARSDVRWRLPGTSDRLRGAFAEATCNGCHGGEHTVVDGAFHVSPLRTGLAKLSPFLHDPSRPGEDDLARRERDLALRLGPR